MKQNKARRLTEHLDEKYVLMAAYPEAVFRKHRHGLLMKRILIVAACVAILAVGMVAVLLPALRSDPGVATDPPETQSPLSPDADWVEDPTIVKVQRLSASRGFDEGDGYTLPDPSVSVDAVRAIMGERLILLRFTCRDGETITVTPSADGALVEALQQELNGRPYWHIAKSNESGYEMANEFLNVNSKEELARLGQSVTLTEDTVLLWQYPCYPRACVQDNFVDFTITDSEGSIKGGGSIYIGGLDLTTVSENKTYYSTSRGPSNVNLNAAYRPVLLGAYRYAEGTEVDAEIHAQKLSALREKAAQTRAHLFDDLSDDDFRLSYRTLLYKYGADMKPGISVTTLHADPAYDRYAVVTAGKEQKQFFLYDGTCQPITEWEIYTADEYGYTVTGKLTLADGTVVMVDINDPERMYEIILPNE